MFVIEHLLFVLGTFCISFSTFFLHSFVWFIIIILNIWHTYAITCTLYISWFHTYEIFFHGKKIIITNEIRKIKTNHEKKRGFHSICFIFFWKTVEKRIGYFFFLKKMNFPFLLLLLLTSFYEISIWKSGKKSEKIFSIEF